MDLDSTHPTVASAMDKALRWLAVRGRSRAQVEARLRQAGFSDEIAAAVGARLVELGILSDRDFALAGVETGLCRGLSRPYLQHQLEGRGVAARDAMWALDVAGNQEPDAVRALELAEAWARAHPSLVDAPGGRAMRRLGAMLLRKGYDEELVGDVCRAVLGDPSGILDEGTGAEGSTEGVELD